MLAPTDFGIDPLPAIVGRCLRVAPEAIDPHAPLARYGLDSLSALELCVAIAEATGIEVDEEDLLDSPSIHDLARRMAMRGARAAPAVSGVERLLADSRLARAIDPAQVPPATGDAVLLTGATGFLGTHLLAALARAGCTTIVCPVRARDDLHARERLAASSARYGIRNAPAGARVIPIAADLVDPQLGLAASDYGELALACGAVVHCAADVNWALGYEAVRAANVLATLNLLRFASCRARKRFHFISSLAARYSTRAAHPATEDDPPADPAGVHFGYAQSKWVSERLVEDCRNRGLAATLYRPSLITGDSASGIGNDDDLLAQLVRGAIALGCAPDLDWQLDACPVDHVAGAVARCVRSPAPELPALHLRNPRPARWREAVLWMNLRGYRVALSPYADWAERAERASREPAHPLHRLRGFLFAPGALGRTLPEIYADPAIARVDAERSDRLLERLGLACPRLGAQQLGRLFDAWIERGALPDAGSGRARAAVSDVIEDAAVAAELRRALADPAATVIASRRIEFGSEHSILGELASWHAGNPVTMHARALEVACAGGRRLMLDIVVKPKYADASVLGVATRVAAACNPALGAAFAAHGEASGLAGSARRERSVYARAEGALRAVLPRCYGVLEGVGAGVLLLERVRSECTQERLDPSRAWPPARIEAALGAIAQVHGEWLERGEAADRLLGGDHAAELDRAGRAGALWRALCAYARPRLLAWIGEQGARAQAGCVASAPEWLAEHSRHARTLIHNDFNPRNLVLRRAAGGLRLCAFDWELAAFGLPQRDGLELMCYVLPCDASRRSVEHLIEHHRKATAAAARRALDPSQWRDGVRLALADFGVRRLPMYFMADRFRPQPYLERVTRTWWRLAGIYGLPST